MARIDYQITVVDTIGKWHKAPAADLVRRAGVPLRVAERWAKVRREMSPAGLKRKLREQVN
jgi:uncharacterized protein (DUF2384 family)